MCNDKSFGNIIAIIKKMYLIYKGCWEIQLLISILRHNKNKNNVFYFMIFFDKHVCKLEIIG